MKEISNNKLTLLRKLNQKKYRQKQSSFLVEGARAVEQIIENGQPHVVELFFDESQHYWQQEAWNEVVKKNSCSTIPEDTFAEISDTDHPQGVIALCRMPVEISLEALSSQKGMIIATDAIQDPGNLGTIIRTANWFGVQGLLLGKGTVDVFHPKVVRSTAGATGMIPYLQTNLGDALPYLEKEGWDVCLLDAGKDAKSLKDVRKNEKTILVVGNEANGIDAALFSPNRQKVCISSPQAGGHVESLNAAIATSIALYALNM